MFLIATALYVVYSHVAVENSQFPNVRPQNVASSELCVKKFPQSCLDCSVFKNQMVLVLLYFFTKIYVPKNCSKL